MEATWTAVMQAARAMTGLGRPWFVAGGWAIDLHRGSVSRGHGDVEIGILRNDQERLWEHLFSGAPGRARADVAIDGKWNPWDGRRIELPLHQIRVRGWGSRGATGEFEIFLNEGDPVYLRSR